MQGEAERAHFDADSIDHASAAVMRRVSEAWLGGRESNPDSLVQSQLSYH